MGYKFPKKVMAKAKKLNTYIAVAAPQSKKSVDPANLDALESLVRWERLQKFRSGPNN